MPLFGCSAHTSHTGFWCILQFAIPAARDYFLPSLPVTSLCTLLSTNMSRPHASLRWRDNYFLNEVLVFLETVKVGKIPIITLCLTHPPITSLYTTPELTEHNDKHIYRWSSLSSVSEHTLRAQPCISLSRFFSGGGWHRAWPRDNNGNLLLILIPLLLVFWCCYSYCYSYIHWSCLRRVAHSFDSAILGKIIEEASWRPALPWRDFITHSLS
jgi:hypothetical protein